MKQITVYGLLGKIYNGNTDMPKKVMYESTIYELIEDNRPFMQYVNKNQLNNSRYLMYMVDSLGDKLDIIEEDNKIEKIGNDYYHKTQPEQNQIFQRKINEIIDVINEMKKGE